VRRLCVSLGLIVLVGALCAVHIVYLGRFTRELTGLLSQAQAEVEREDWGEAARLTEQARERWEGHGGYLHTTLRHTDIDAILISFDETLAFLRAGERQSAEYAAVNQRLITQLELLLEAELPTLTNVL